MATGSRGPRSWRPTEEKRAPAAARSMESANDDAGEAYAQIKIGDEWKEVMQYLGVCGFTF